ncbi:MAG: ATP-binding protein [Clostridia bacterium]|nr:ATP-binding protein [Clostridia bacterium]
MPGFDEAVAFTSFGNRTVGMVVINIDSVPHYSLMSDVDIEAVTGVKLAFTSILNEFSRHRTDNTISLEMLWHLTPATNQSFLSNINLLVVLRNVGESIDRCRGELRIMANDLVSELNGLKIVSSYGTVSDYLNIINENSTEQLRAIRRSDDMVQFNIPQFPYCYKYDAIQPFEIDLDSVVGTMINERRSMLVIQLISTCFTDQEKMYIQGCLNSLSQLSNGIHMPRVGFYRDPRAELPLKTYKKYYDEMNSPMLLMNILVTGSEFATSNLSSKVISLLGDGEHEARVKSEVVNITDSMDKLRSVGVSPWLISDIVMMGMRDRSVLTPATYRLAHVYSPAEASQIFRAPIGTRRVTAGVNIHEVEKRNKEFAPGIINVSDLSVGKLQNVIGGENSLIGIKLKDLTKHMLVVGTPGSGKSTFLVGLMDRLWKDHKIPFIVIEPAKNEYRSLIDSIPELQVFSPGKNDVAPYIINPFVPPKGVTVEKYKSIVKAAFSAAFEMWTPLDQLFDETLNICYSEQGWLDSYTVDENAGDCFSLIDFIETYKEVVGSKGYSGEYKKQIEAAGVLRLNGLLEQNPSIFDTRHSVPIGDILNTPTVIELANIKDIKQKSFIIAMILNNIYAYVEANHPNDGQLKNVILLEEAHALISADAGGSEDASNANAAAVKLIKDMLAEIRSRGVGIVIADQSPKKVTSEVIANTNVKVMFRIVESDDKEILRRSTGMNDNQQERFAKLRCGQALFYFDRLDEVEEISMDDYRLNNGISTDTTDEGIRRRMTYWQGREKLLMPYPDCDYIPHCEGGCNGKTRESAKIIAERIFRKSYPARFKDIASFKEFYRGINSLIANEILTIFKDAELYHKIAHCVKVQLLRKIHYNTDIDLSLMRRIPAYKAMKT